MNLDEISYDERSDVTKARWEIMENMQEANPHFWFGWDGIIVIVCWV